MRWLLLSSLVLDALADDPPTERAPPSPAKYMPVLDKHSFRTPNDLVNEFTGSRQIDGWDLGGSAVAHRSFVRLNAERQGQKGWIVNRNPFSEQGFSLEMELRASGGSPYLYGDGLAIWFVDSYEHIEGPVFGREDYWKGLGIFFDTFQNIDHQHHHRHPYIYAVVNDGTMHYVPDAEKKEQDSTKQALPGAAENSGCSFDFRYHEARHDVSVLNHTRVHVFLKDAVLKMRVQQTYMGGETDWYECFQMRNVQLPMTSGYFGVSAATGDLVDNHDIIHFTVRSLADVDDPLADYEHWMTAEKQSETLRIEEHDLRPAEALQRDYQRVLRAQAKAIKQLNADVDKLKQQMEFQIASMATGISVARKEVDEKAEQINLVSQKVEEAEAVSAQLKEAKTVVENIKEEVSQVKKNSGGWGWPFILLFVMLIALAGVGYNRYRKIMKSHLP
jgi:hypothetical protein|mmetsp:Transcript_53984/g.124284  ORF Transcript_53984/g.124284 Transcript_53984/m.124284 type:complete len:446 (-) Transcript_53984:94-1431(-)